MNDFITFTKILLGEGDEEQRSFPDEPFGHPLLLNAKNQLCLFEKENKILCSKFADIFPHSPHMFLHESLIRCSYSQSYFISKMDQNCGSTVKELMETVLPVNLKSKYVRVEDEGIDLAVISHIWKCLINDCVFRSVLPTVLKEWALLLTNDHRLFRCESDDQLLPIIPPADSAHHDISSVIQHNLKGPFLDTRLIPVEIAHQFCPQLSYSKQILKHLFHLNKEFPFSEVINVTIASKLLRYFSTIHLKQEVQCCNYIRCLPLFETVHGKLTVIEGKRVYIWPGKICKKGIEKCLRGTDLVFLKPSGEWKSLGVTDTLGIRKITPEEIYMQFIFPKFSELDKSERYTHLVHIREELFNTNLFNMKRDSRFISQLGALPCIGDDGKPLQPVRNFHTHKKVIFRTFPKHFQVLPDIFIQKDGQWMEFFENLGLQQQVSSEVFIDLCNDVANGKMKEKTKASSKVLVNYLFSKEEANSHGFHDDPNLLAKVSEIAFVCPLPAPELEWIHKIPQVPNCVILSGGKEEPLCTLAGSCLSQFKELIWAVRAIISIKGRPDEKLLRSLGISEPTAEDVLLNVKALSKTCFSDRNQFMQYTVPHCQKDQKELMDVLAMMFEHLQESKESMDALKSLPCIPVYAMLDKEGGQFPVLIKPQCVVFRPTNLTQPFYPFIHSVQQPLLRASKILEEIGVKHSIELEHMQIVLESAYNDAGSMELDPNAHRAVISAMKEIENILKQDTTNKMGDKSIVEKLAPLYLPGADKKLHLVEFLVYTNIYEGDVDLTGKNLFLLWLPDGMFAQKFCELLPKEIRPRPLSQICTRRLSTTCKPCENVPSVDELKRALMIPNLAQAMCLLVASVTSSESLDEETSSIFSEHITNFLGSLEINCVKPLRIDLFLMGDGSETKIASESVSCFIEEKEQAYHLYIDGNIGGFDVADIYDYIAKQLLSCLKDTEELTLNNLQKLFAKLLRSNNTYEVYNFLQKNQISCTEFKVTIDYDHQLVIGAPLPDSLHFRFDQNNNNIFQPQEYVAYQPIDDDKVVIVALVIHAVHLKDDSGKPLKPRDVEYIILIGEEDKEENRKQVKAIEIYKFLRGNIAPKESESECQELVRFEGNPDDVPAATASPVSIDVEQAKDEVRQELKEIWCLPKEERKRAINRLYLRWHPDKNPHDQDAAEQVFKFLQQELDRLKAGIAPATTSTYSWFDWRQFQHSWDYTARQHRQYNNDYQQEYHSRPRPNHRHRSRGGASHFFFEGVYTPPKRETEAQKWVKQATVDAKVLSTLLNEARGDEKMSCHVCFMAHEVAEKALKGAMYATCGLRENMRESHNIIPFALAIEQVKPETAGLSTFARPLEPTYYMDTRFPKDNPSSSPPCDVFTFNNAEEAETCALGILKIVRDIVET